MPLPAALPLLMGDLERALNKNTEALMQSNAANGAESDPSIEALAEDITNAIHAYAMQGQVIGLSTILPKFVPDPFANIQGMPSDGRGLFGPWFGFGNIIPILGLETGSPTDADTDTLKGQLIESITARRIEGSKDGADSDAVLLEFSAAFADHIWDYAMSINLLTMVINGPWIHSPATVGPLGVVNLPILMLPGEPGLGTSKIPGRVKTGLNDDFNSAKTLPLQQSILAAYQNSTAHGANTGADWKTVNKQLAAELTLAIHTFFFSSVTITNTFFFMWPASPLPPIMFGPPLPPIPLPAIPPAWPMAAPVGGPDLTTFLSAAATTELNSVLEGALASLAGATSVGALL